MVDQYPQTLGKVAETGVGGEELGGEGGGEMEEAVDHVAGVHLLEGRRIGAELE